MKKQTKKPTTNPTTLPTVAPQGAKAGAVATVEPEVVMQPEPVPRQPDLPAGGKPVDDCKVAAALSRAWRIAKRGEALAEQFSGPLSILGLTDGAGRIDIDAARDLAREALAKTGRIHALGFVFGPDDVDSLATTAERHATA